MNTKHHTKAICSLIMCVLIFGCSLVQMGKPASGNEPASQLLTSAQISTIQLESLLFQAGDLSTEYAGATPITTVPDRYQKLPMSQKQASEQISNNGSWVGDVTVFLYERQADIDQAFLSYTGKKLSEADAVPGMGEKSVFTPFSIPYSGGSIDGAEVMFIRCSAVADIRLITNKPEEVNSFAALLDKRLTPLVCNNPDYSPPEILVTAEIIPTATNTAIVQATAVPTSPSVTTGTFSVNVPGEALWVDTGLKVTAGQTLRISASGIVNTYGGGVGSDSDPNGQTTICQPVENNSNCILNGEPYGLLLGRIAEGTPFRVGANLEMVVHASGTLYLMVNDNYPHYEDNIGSYLVIITLG